MFYTGQPVMLIGGIVGWLKQIHTTLVTIGEFFVNLVTTIVKAILWIPSMIGSLVSTVVYFPPILQVFLYCGIVLLVIYFICRFG